MNLRHLAAAVAVAVLAGLTCIGVAPIARAAASPVVSVVGDSYSRGCTAVCPPTDAGAWWRTTAADLGWTVASVTAEPGAGYARPSVRGKTLLDALRARPISAASDYVLLEGGLNDHAQTVDAVYAGAKATIAEVQRQAPHATIVVVGAFLPSASTTLMTSTYLRAARAIDRAALRAGVRHMSGFMCSFTVDVDRYHPTVDGHRTIGHWVAQEVAQLRS